MKRIVMIPLDDRPCNYKYPNLLPKEDYKIILPPKEYMCNHKNESNYEALSKWLLDNVKNADSLILSMDNLILGGLVPSRLHHYSFSMLKERLNIIKEIRKINPNLLIYGFELIMRCPDYSLDVEEPYYYAECGAEIHELGELTHKHLLNKCTENELKRMDELKSFIKEEYLKDYLDRRNTNLTVLMDTLKLVNDGLFDYFIIPQDDASVYGYTALDQIRVRKYLKDNSLHTRVSMYPSADDVGLSLISRSICELNHKPIKVYVKYSSPKAPYCIPWFEDRPQDETIKYQIISMGGIRVYSLVEADVVLAVNMTSKMLNKDDPDFMMVYDTERNLHEFIEYIKYVKSTGKMVGIADTAYCNGSDTELIKLMAKEQMLLNVDSYAGWNTSSNTLGTTLCALAIAYFGKDNKTIKEFLMYRYIEDYVYMNYSRWKISREIENEGLGYFDLKDQNEMVSERVRIDMLEIIHNDLKDISKYIKDIKINMPWNRMFECDLDIEFCEDKVNE